MENYVMDQHIFGFSQLNDQLMYFYISSNVCLQQ